ncbi:hypothetical protein NIE88_05180 [Sporolactobacillus shoreicorticis]|uniref:Uncharacterized protein n=1 Tax=Sporolactobacillus shoreicorticis TaxID=1923877 RepID=A0ABW5S043_9BACL|nr:MULTISPECIES: hypothetical protein [Sporolactobacillus]MCO7125166.1 hypothetical protein [Sporolactobacillus shoreicorticis]MCQ2009292.1 hypothetical protein [Sporolactobacillus sp. STSJ-5]
MNELNDTMILLLKQCLGTHRPDLLWVLDDSEIDIDEKLGNELRSAVSEELIERGFDKNDEPNQLGIDLENLIDQLGRIFMK